MGARSVHHRELDRAFVSQIGYTEMKCSGCKVGPPQRAGSNTCTTNWIHRNEMQWMQGWSTTESWNEHLYDIGHTEMTYSGCKAGTQQRAGPSSCITLATPKCHAVGARLGHHREWGRAFVSQAGYTEMNCNGCKVGPPQRAGSSICITIWRHRNDMQWVQGWSTTGSRIDHLYYKLATPK